MGMINALDKTGHTATVTWDPADEVSVQEAREVFERLVADPSVGLAQIEDATKNIAVKTTEFDPQAEQYITWRQFAGG